MTAPSHLHVLAPDEGPAARQFEAIQEERERVTFAVDRDQHPESESVERYLILGDLIIPLRTDREILVGRDGTSCDVVLADPRISKKHAAIRFTGDRFFIRDQDSLNGILVNKVKISGNHALVTGDSIYLHPYKLKFVGDNHPVVRRTPRATASDQSSESPGRFAGQLNILSITDLIQLLNSTRQNGTLTLEDNMDRTARIAIHQGEILSATYCGLSGEEAVFLILSLKDGHFEFARGNPPIPPAPLKKATLSLLLDGCRILDETKDIKDPGERDLVKAIPLIRKRDTEAVFRPEEQDCRKLPV
jgi:hypothetical protein